MGYKKKIFFSLKCEFMTDSNCS